LDETVALRGLVVMAGLVPAIHVFDTSMMRQTGDDDDEKADHRIAEQKNGGNSNVSP